MRTSFLLASLTFLPAVATAAPVAAAPAVQSRPHVESPTEELARLRTEHAQLKQKAATLKAQHLKLLDTTPELKSFGLSDLGRYVSEHRLYSRKVIQGANDLSAFDARMSRISSRIAQLTARQQAGLQPL